MQKRIFGLDIIRAVAIIMVVISHCFALLLPLSKAPYDIGWLAGKLIALTIPFDILGVELFFVLSGFLVGSILIKQFQQQKNFNLQSIKLFWIRRWFRTLPNYYLILIVNILLYSYWTGSNMFNWRYFIFSQGLYKAPPDFFGESWSLAIEEWFYLTMPLAIFICSIVFKKISKQKILLSTIVSYVAFFALLKIVYAITYAYQDSSASFVHAQGRGLRKIVSLRLDAIGFGVLMAYLNYYKKEALFQLRKKLFGIGLIGTVTLAALHYLGTYPGIQLYQYKAAMVLSNAFLYILIPIFFSCLLPFAASIESTKKNVAEKVIVYISSISYSIYLVHLSLIYDPFFKKLQATSAIAALKNCLLYFLLVIGVSSLLYFLYEKPMTALRNKFK